jgi:hypothetical protein
MTVMWRTLKDDSKWDKAIVLKGIDSRQGILFPDKF